jgi:acetoin utilization deacetylase AcuC-like enzyme
VAPPPRSSYGTPGVGLYVHHPSSYEHDTGAHPENASRLQAIESELGNNGWLGLDRRKAPAATREQLLRVHSLDYLRAVEGFCVKGGGMLDADTVASQWSYEAALHAAGGAAWAAEALLGGEDGFAVCALRPPGHHAERARAMGFCLLNNIAVAAAHAIEACGAQRVFILDWDVHHGNGTEAIFAASADVLYTSIHQWPLYPGTGEAGYEGEAAGAGFTVNMPVPPGSGNDVFTALVEHVVAPVARVYRPGLVAISAGFDAHREDPLADCLVDEAGYLSMAATVRLLAAELSTPVLVCLEGGYAPAALAQSMRATVEALGGDALPVPAPIEAAGAYTERARRVVAEAGRAAGATGLAGP